MCWYNFHCPLGSAIKDANDNLKCTKPCPCPTWTSGCSHTQSNLSPFSNKDIIPKPIREFKPPRFCSYTPDNKCSNITVTGYLNQVQLYDDTEWIVPILNLQTLDYYSKDDYYCFSINDTNPQPSAPPPYTGTSQFCVRKDCTTGSSTFCTFGNPTTELLLESHSPIPIKAHQEKLLHSQIKNEIGSEFRTIYGMHHRRIKSIVRNTGNPFCMCTQSLPI